MNTTNYLTSLQSFKTFMNAGTKTTADEFINQQIPAISTRIEAYTRRKLRGRSYLEYHDGGGHSKISTNQRPIISVETLHDDTNHEWGDSSLIAAADYVIIQDSGIIQLYAGVFSRGIKNVQISYYAGYNEYQIITGINDSIDFKESGGGPELTATLAAGVYILSDLITHIKTKMEAIGSNTYTITYDYTTGKFNIAGETFLSLLWSTGTNTSKSTGRLLGYNTSADDTAAITYLADNSSLGIPSDLELATNIILYRDFMASPYGNDRFDLKNKIITGERAGTTTYVGGDFPPEALSILNRYRRINVF